MLLSVPALTPLTQSSALILPFPCPVVPRPIKYHVLAFTAGPIMLLPVDPEQGLYIVTPILPPVMIVTHW